MGAMNPVARFFINLGNAGRSRRILASIEPTLVLPPSPSLLELGAGRGGLSALLYEKYRPRRLVVSDFDPHQLAEAQRYLSHRLCPLPPSVEFLPVDARALPFEDATFDCVTAMLMLHHVEAHHGDYRERPVALREIRRVLAPGGLLVYADFSRTADLHQTLSELGFTTVFERRRWPRLELAIYRSPGASPTP